MLRLRLLLASLLAAGLVVAGFPSLTGPLPSAAAETAMQARPAVPIVGEFFALSGKLSTAVSRPVKLQRWNGSRWVVLASASTNRRGGYGFTGQRTRVVSRYRSLAPRVRVNGRLYLRLVTPTRVVKPVGQTGSLHMLPPIAQYGTTPQASGAAKSVVETTFRPIRRGRVVVLQRKVGTGWVEQARGRQDARGRVTFNAPTKVNRQYVQYRAVTVAANGAAARATPASYTNLWHRPFLDEFGGTSLNTTKWDYRRTGEQTSDRSTVSPQTVSVGNGYLAMTIKRDPSRAGHLLNGQVGTHNGMFSMKYGVMAARMRFPRSQGQHGAFWSMPSTGSPYTGSPEDVGAEIDTVEYFGNGNSCPQSYRPNCRGSGLGSYVHYWDSSGKKMKTGGTLALPGAQRYLGSSTDDWFTGFHVFSVEWTPSRYVFRIDGKETFRTTRGVSQQPQHLILSLLTSNWEIDRLDLSVQPRQMQVDWVQAWQR